MNSIECKACGEAIEGGQAVYCRSCGSPHHRACFEFRGACAEYDCQGTSSSPRRTAAAVAPPARPVVLQPHSLTPSGRRASTRPGHRRAAPVAWRVPWRKRVGGTFIDLLVSWIGAGFLGYGLSMLLPKVLADFLAISVACAYILLRDALFGDGRSLGKKLADYRVLGPDGSPCTFAQSAGRNLTIALWHIFPLLWMALRAAAPSLQTVFLVLSPLFLFGAPLLWFIELLKISVDPQGKRLGDALADTRAVRNEYESLRLRLPEDLPTSAIEAGGPEGPRT